MVHTKVCTLHIYDDVNLKSTIWARFGLGILFEVNKNRSTNKWRFLITIYLDIYDRVHSVKTLKSRFFFLYMIIRQSINLVYSKNNSLNLI